MRRLGLITAALVALRVGTAVGAPEALESSFQMSSGARYVVQLTQVLVGSAPQSSSSFGYWGREGAVPSKCISSLKVTRNGKSVDVQGKMYVDLCNARNLELSEARGLFILKFSGGDAGDSYLAEFRFRGVYLTERWVRHGEFPEEAYEHTKFRYNTSDR